MIYVKVKFIPSTYIMPRTDQVLCIIDAVLIVDLPNDWQLTVVAKTGVHFI